MTDRLGIDGGAPVRRQPLPFHRPDLGAAEEAAVLEVLRSGWLTRGPRTEEFERRLITQELEKSGWNQTECARRLRVALSTLNQKVQRLNIEIKKKKDRN